MIRNILGADFKYEDDKMYRKLKTKWNCLSDNKVDKLGYIRLSINNKRYYLHRLIYKYHNEDWDITDISTKNQIDHININPLDNKIENLRIVNQSQNNRNRTKLKNCSSKYIGVSWFARDKKWQVSIKISGKSKNLGTYETEEEAHKVYQIEYDKIMNILNEKVKETVKCELCNIEIRKDNLKKHQATATCKKMWEFVLDSD